jgi:HAD superfamily hydrolase (TIGR01509 family)
MIKHIIFDMDGVLVDARDIHFEALNEALKKVDNKYIISRQEHLSSYDGLPTRKKLEKLTLEKGFPEIQHNFVWKKKQDATLKIIEKMRPDRYMIEILKDLRRQGYTIHVCSNSVRKTIDHMLSKKGLLRYIDKIFSNEDVKRPKPCPEIFLQSIIDVGVSPRETLIIEDSPIGRRAALDSCSHLHAVRGTYDVHYEEIKHTIEKINKAEEMNRPKWQGKNMNVLIPMAGAGSRFEKAGYTFPKPLIEVNGKPMIQLVVENLNIDARHIFIVQKSHCEKYNLKSMLNTISPDCKVVEVDGITEGAACTTLLAKEFIDNDEPLLMANSDQYVDWDSTEFMYSMIGDEIDAGILTFESLHPKWSYVRLNDDGFVDEVAEKNPISNRATVGIYYWSKGSDYVKYAEDMIAKDIRHNNEFYVCPVFNQAIEDKKKIKIFDIDSKDMWGLGTPEDLNTFVNSKRIS